MAKWEIGRLAGIEYSDERTLHHRLLLRPTTAAVFKKVMGFDPQGTAKNLWWAVTPDGDIVDGINIARFRRTL